MLGYDSPRAYFTVPSLGGYGPEFPDYDTAAAYALTTITEITPGGRYTTAWVTCRLADKTGDREVGRWEISVQEIPPRVHDSVTFEHQRGPAETPARKLDRIINPKLPLFESGDPELATIASRLFGGGS